MAQDRRLSHLNDADERMSMARVLDLSDRARRSKQTGYTHFMNPREALLAADILKGQAGIRFDVWGGYPDAERCLVAVGPDHGNNPDREEFPIRILQAKPRSKRASIGHRACLGALMGLGIHRERLGDIVITDHDGAFLVVHEDIESFVLDNLTKIGAEWVDASTAGALETGRMEPDSDVVLVPSLRLDAIVSKGFAIKRREAEESIRKGGVQVNWRSESRKAASVREGDVVSCRSRGRIKVLERLGTSRRGQEKILIRRYR